MFIMLLLQVFNLSSRFSRVQHETLKELSEHRSDDKTKILPNISGRCHQTTAERTLVSLPLNKGSLNIWTSNGKSNDLDWSKLVTSDLDDSNVIAAEANGMKQYTR